MYRKQLILLAFCVLLVAGVATISAQEAGANGRSTYFVKSLVITQVAMGDNGYRVTYRNGAGQLHYAYIPHDWFSETAGRGEQIRTWNKAAPYMDVYYQDGQFSHVRLFLIPTFDHVSWTVLSDQDDTEANFSSEELVINYN